MVPLSKCSLPSGYCSSSEPRSNKDRKDRREMIYIHNNDNDDKVNYDYTTVGMRFGA